MLSLYTNRKQIIFTSGHKSPLILNLRRPSRQERGEGSAARDTKKCLDVSEQVYLKVRGGNVWSGFEQAYLKVRGGNVWSGFEQAYMKVRGGNVWSGFEQIYLKGR
jgi:hypothetical protein